MSSAQGTLQHTAEFTGVQHHPVMEHVFATSDAHGQVCLRDTRMAFGPLSNRSNNGIVRVVRPTFLGGTIMWISLHGCVVQHEGVEKGDELSQQSGEQ